VSAPTDDPFVAVPMSVLLALADAAANDVGVMVVAGNYSEQRSYQALALLLRFMAVRHPKVRDKWLEQWRFGEDELIEQLRKDTE
jgi:hypothetical protein